MSEDVSYGLMTVAGHCFVNRCLINTGNVPKLSRAAVPVRNLRIFQEKAIFSSLPSKFSLATTVVSGITKE